MKDRVSQLRRKAAAMILCAVLTGGGFASGDVMAAETDAAAESDEAAAAAEADAVLAAQAENVTDDAVPETLEFTDVRGEVHTLVVDPTAAMHDYDAESFLTIGQNIIYTDDTKYTWRLGLDVSYYQGNIDWYSVAAEGYSFVFIRIGYRGYGQRGALVEDSMFRGNLEGAKAAGLDVGVYFFSQAVSAEEAAEEAQFVLSLLNGTDLELPIVYDPEFILNDDGSRATYARMASATGAQVTLNAQTFCTVVEAAGYESAFYSNLLYESEVYDMTLLSPYTVWYADYNSVPQTPYDFTFWQFSESGKISGISGSVDLDLQLIPVAAEETAEIAAEDAETVSGAETAAGDAGNTSEAGASAEDVSGTGA